MPPEITELTLNWTDLRNILVGVFLVAAMGCFAWCAFLAAQGRSQYRQIRNADGKLVGLVDRERAS